MSNEQQDESTLHDFEHAPTFNPGELSGGLGLGTLEAQYEELFAEALEDGVITTEERARLQRAADNLGLDPQRLLKLEQAMVAAYETRHHVRIIEHYEEPAASLSPLKIEADGDQAKIVLLKRIEQLEARVRELEEELRRAQASINVEVDLGSLEAAAEAASEDPEEIWRQVRRDPARPEPLRALYRVYEARGDTDKSWCVSQALVLLEAANDEEQQVFEKHRTQTLITPIQSVSAQDWCNLLFHPEEEVLTGQIFAVISPAVLLGRVSALRRDGKLHRPAPDSQQDPKQATVTAVRAIPWAAAILGLAPPPIYVEKDRDTAYEHIPSIPPITVIGKQVLSGLTQLEHAFHVGRHLSFYRQEHFVKTLFSSVPDLEDLFLAALVIGNPALPIAEDMKRRVTPISKAIEPLLEKEQLDRLRALFLRFVEEGGRTNLQRFSQATEKTACRAGMLLCNDLLTAASVLEKNEGKLGEFAKDLIAFISSKRYFDLRNALGISLSQN